MDVDGELNHVVSRNALALVFGVRLTCVRQIERCVELLGSHGRVGWINDHIASVNPLQQALGVHHVGLLLHILEVLGLSLFVLHALLVRVEYDVAIGNAAEDILLTREINGLRQVADIADALAGSQAACQFNRNFLAHAVGNHISRRIAEQALLKAVAPVVVMAHAT